MLDVVTSVKILGATGSKEMQIVELMLELLVVRKISVTQDDLRASQ